MSDAKPMTEDELAEIRVSSWPVDRSPHEFVPRLLATIDMLRLRAARAEARKDAALTLLHEKHGDIAHALERAKIERDQWKRRAAQHGCDVSGGDVDCG